MIKKILSFLLILSYSVCFSQDYELRVTPYINCKIIYKDNTSEKGLLRLASSAFKPQFKNSDKEKPKKIDYELIDKIISNPDTENERIFQYLNHNYSKFKIFVELIYEDGFQIFISSTDADELFYSDFDRQSIGEMMDQARFERNLEFNERLKTSDTLILPNGKKMTLPMRYSYFYGLDYGVAYGNTPMLTYYISKIGNEKIYKVEKNKRFLKKAKEFIDDCPIIINDLEHNKLTPLELPRFIEYYKDVCGIQTKSEN